MKPARQAMAAAVALALCSAWVAGCHHVGPPTDEADGGGGDGDTDTDTEQDSYSLPTDTSEGYCQEEPVYCSDVGPTPAHQYMGCCFDGALYWCWEQDQIWVDSIDCELNGGACGYDPQSEWMDCLYD
jgi:hypothetical protein